MRQDPRGPYKRKLASHRLRCGMVYRSVPTAVAAPAGTATPVSGMFLVIWPISSLMGDGSITDRYRSLGTRWRPAYSVDVLADS